MKRTALRHGACLVASGLTAMALVATAAVAQTPIDSSLLSYIDSIRAIDSHAHPMRFVATGAAADTEYDALPLDGIPAFSLPGRVTLEDPIWRRAEVALYHIPAGLSDSPFADSVSAAAKRSRETLGARFPAWVLDQAGIETMMANRIVPGPGVAAPRFRWVSYVDALLLPLDTRAEAARTPDTRSLYPREQALLARYLRELGVARLPATLDAYIRSVVRPTLDRQRAGGAVAVKFEAAYLRPLNFDAADSAAAARIYARYVRGGVPSAAEYKLLQDYLFHVVAREAGRRNMAVQIHTLETFGGFYASAGAAPHLLEPAFNDSTLRGTRFVVVHGGWPLVGETQGLLAKPNVYTDISMMDVMLSPHELANVLRQWLGEYPDKVLFGTDAFDGGLTQGWEQVAWVASYTARHALAMALTGMLRDGEIDADRARVLARMVMRENALRVYDLGAR
ncbi:MAG TPA: hypothetical protein VF159_01250 [Gemmatimonadaceae bacterium]